MSIQNTIRIINRVEKIVADLKLKYSHASAHHELTKLASSLNALLVYLNELDHLKPNSTTNEIDDLMAPIDLNLDILKAELEAADFKKINNGIKVVKRALRFHPTKYSAFELIVLWFYELIYFI